MISTSAVKKGLLSLLLISRCLTLQAQRNNAQERADSLLAIMTLDEKVGQLNQYSGGAATGPVTPGQSNLFNEIRAGRVGSLLNVKGAKQTRAVQQVAMQSRLKIPLLFGLDVIHGYHTVFPIPLAEAASWDLDMMRQTAHIAAREAAASGIHWTFAPMVDVARDPRWGRVMEGAGEDPYLGSLIAAARVKGFQGETLGGTDAVMACAKHFAAYSAVVAGRDYNTVNISDHDLWETYLPPFKAAADAGVATFMNAFNTLDGIPATGNRYLQRDILKGEWKFSGFLVSDWGSIGEMVPWGFAENNADAAQKAITAGNDMDMESRAYRNHLATLVNTGKVPEAILNNAVRRILIKKFELGLFDDPYRFCDSLREIRVLSDVSAKVVALNMARKSIVLLKNDGILPLANKAQNIALIGPLGKTKSDLLGSWTLNTDTSNVLSLYDAIQGQMNKKSRLAYTKGCEADGNNTSGFGEAIALAKKADIIIMALGEKSDMTGEAASRTDIGLPGRQEALFDSLATMGKPIIVLLMAGRPMVFTHISERASAIVYTWWLGEQAGNAIADIIYGNYNPSGRLPISFPRSAGQIPIYYAQNSTGRPLKEEGKTGYVSAYRDSKNSAQYAFGYGLSYTKFDYSDLQLSKTMLRGQDSVTVSFKLENAGNVAGEETVQLYIHDFVSSVVRPVKELKDFAKVKLEPGKTTVVRFRIHKDKLSFFNSAHQWVTEPGAFELMIGSASDSIKLRQKITWRQ